MRMLLAFTAFMAVVLSTGATGSPNCYALLIGINTYADKTPPVIPDLACTHADCELVKSLLPMMTGLPEDAIHVSELYDAQATKAAVLATLDDMAEQVTNRDTLVIYYSGHGALVPDMDGDEPAGDGALILQGFTREDRPSTATEISRSTITDDEMAIQLRRFAKATRVFYIADCCHSGGNERDLGSMVEKGFEMPLTVEQQNASRAKGVLLMPDGNRLGQENVIAVFACDSRSKAQEIRTAGHGAMTMCIAELLTYPARYDADCDGMLELDELSAGLRSLVEKTVSGYSNGTKHQLSFVKALRKEIWSLPVDSATRAVEGDITVLHGVPEKTLSEVISGIGMRCMGRYDAGDEPYELLSFSFIEEDGTSRADDVFLESELTDALGQPYTTLSWRFTLDAPADVIALLIDTDGNASMLFPNSPESIVAQANLDLTVGMRTSVWPFTIPSQEYYGKDRFVINIGNEGWEYIVLICSPVALEDPHGTTGSAFDLVYPFSALSGESGGIEKPSEKGFGGLSTTDDSEAGLNEVIVEGKMLTFFYEKYWLLR